MSQSNILNILFVGDIVGRLGRAITKKVLPATKQEFSIDLTIANGENSSGGYGITEKAYNELVASGIDMITMGNHIFDKKDFAKTLANCPNIVRPANFPPDVPGKDLAIMRVKDVNVAIVNLLGRVFMQAVDCPFRTADKLLGEKIKKDASVIIVDMHAEATSEKAALGFYLDGRVAAVLGTHTHVMTADEKILPMGTAFISDLGMVGALDSVIGMQKEPIIARFLTQMPHRFEPVREGRGIFNAVVLKVDAKTGLPVEFKRINKEVAEIKMESGTEGPEA